jgi:hypothetical protein
MEKNVLIREKRREGNVMLRGQVLAELPDDKVRVKIQGQFYPREVNKADVLEGSKVFGPPVAGQRPSIVTRQYSQNVNSLSRMLLEK